MFAGLGTALAHFWSDQRNAFRRLMSMPPRLESADYWRQRYERAIHDRDELNVVYARSIEEIAHLRQSRDGLLQYVYPTHDQAPSQGWPPRVRMRADAEMERMLQNQMPGDVTYVLRDSDLHARFTPANLRERPTNFTGTEREDL